MKPLEMSLNARIVLAASLVLAIFLFATAFALDRAFRESALTARQERLQGQIYLLIAAAEVTPRGQLNLPAQTAEPRLSQPGSGLYGLVADGAGQVVWRSHSALNLALPAVLPIAAGRTDFSEARAGGGPRFLTYRLGVNWAAGGGHYPFTFMVAEDRTAFDAQIAHYRHSLWGWLAGMAVLLVAAQGVLLRWGLGPLRRVAGEIRAIEGGAQTTLGGDYPPELRALTENLNSLLQRERGQRQRYRDALGDLAHSLKTPLAVMRGALAEKTPATLVETVAEETEKMQRIVDYQLQRAAMAGPSSRLTTPLEILPVAQRIVASLDKVYRDKMVESAIEISPGLAFRVDQGDLLELLGNLLDNAYKWCAGQVRLAVQRDEGALLLTLDDDGSGIPSSEAERLLQRGARADQSFPGQGIGLAVVAGIVNAYNGKITIGNGPLGGARVEIRLPA